VFVLAVLKAVPGLLFVLFIFLLDRKIRQGPVLEAAALPIGVVEGIVAQRRYILTILGRSSHAGTTPMTMRQDALVAAAQVILAVQTLGMAHDPLVATVGSITAAPNASNVIANRVELSLDVRDMSDDRVEFVVESLRDRCREIAQTTCTQISWRCTLNTPAAPASPDIQQIIAQASRNRNLGSMVLPSRAGHDAQDMAAIAPMGMIFVPSVGGISHSASEYTTPEQCAQGTNTLLETFLLLDQLPKLG
jgi:N-carbamoyl-L-amino-acid hydrolase